VADSSNGTEALAPDELTAMLRSIRDRVRARYSGEVPDEESAAYLEGAFTPVDLLPVIHARDAALGKVAAIGSVNPRPPGLANQFVQGVKRLVARMLDWHVREQVEFNRSTILCVETLLEALNECNRLMALQHVTHRRLGQQIERLQQDHRDLVSHSNSWHEAAEGRLEELDATYLRGLAEARGAFEHRLLQLHGDFTRESERGLLVHQKEYVRYLEQARRDMEALIHQELRVLRQRQLAAAEAQRSGSVAEGSHVAAEPPIDWLKFADRFRGTEESVRERQRFYLPFFAGCREVLDAGCGRGEFLSLLQEADIPGYGVEASEELVKLCQSRGLRAVFADMFEHLESLPDACLDGIFAAQVVEHIPPEKLPGFVSLCGRKLRRGGVLALETPDPACLAIFSTHFYIDPTHQRPVPSQLMAYYLEEGGFGSLEVHRLAPAVEAFPALGSLAQDLREQFFGGLDYGIIGRKL
jgi:SAM-dependent methyltransferase